MFKFLIEISHVAVTRRSTIQIAKKVLKLKDRADRNACRVRRGVLANAIGQWSLGALRAKMSDSVFKFTITSDSIIINFHITFAYMIPIGAAEWSEYCAGTSRRFLRIREENNALRLTSYSREWC